VTNTMSALRRIFENLSSVAITVAVTIAVSMPVIPLLMADDKIENRVAVFSGIDKITGRIITFDVYVDENSSVWCPAGNPAGVLLPARDRSTKDHFIH